MSGVAAFERLRAQLAPDLELIRPLGRGSAAQVYLAREPALERLVAVKVLREEVAADAVVRQRFDRESRAAARLKHPNVPAIYRVAESDGVPFIVMEYVEGRTLEGLLAAGGPLEIAEARRVLASTAHALAAVHARGLVHRDVRPGNIMVENVSGRVVLVDFGIVALLETGAAPDPRLTKTGIQVGDPRHMSPEQLQGEPVGPASDVYGLGVVAYELLLGETPLPNRALAPPDISSDPQPTWNGVRLRPIDELRPDIDPMFAAVIQKCLSPLADHRPRAIDVADALVRTPGGAEPRAEPTVHAQVGARSAADHPAVRAIPGLGEFVEELQRRRVGRTAVTYIIAASLPVVIVNAFAHVFPGGEGGAWHRGALAAILSGFPVALVLSWLFTFSPSGVRREATVREGGRTSGRGIRRLLLPVAGLALAVLLVGVLWRLFGPG